VSFHNPGTPIFERKEDTFTGGSFSKAKKKADKFLSKGAVHCGGKKYSRMPISLDVVPHPARPRFDPKPEFLTPGEARN